MCFKRAVLLKSPNIWGPGAFGHGWELFKKKKGWKDIIVQEKSICKCDLRPLLKIAQLGKSVAIGCGRIGQNGSVDWELSQRDKQQPGFQMPVSQATEFLGPHNGNDL